MLQVLQREVAKGKHFKETLAIRQTRLGRGLHRWGVAYLLALGSTFQQGSMKTGGGRNQF